MAGASVTRSRVLAGAKAWLISDGKAGHEAQSLGVAEALGVDVEWKRVAPSGVWRFLAPWGPVAPKERFGAAGTGFAPPWPKLAIAIGRTTIPYLRALKRRAGANTFTVVLLDPKTGAGTADLFWVPEHDRRRGSNVVTTVTSPHRFTAERLEKLRAEMPADIAGLPTPRVAVLIGGPNGVYTYSGETIARLSAGLWSLSRSGVGLMITASRRTPQGVVDAIRTVTDGSATLFYAGEGENPYPAFLAAADAFVVTADSVNMLGEAAATGRPIHVFHPDGGSPKFDHFHRRLKELGVTRDLTVAPSGLESWTYEPLASAGEIAAEIERRILRCRAVPGGLS